MPVAIIQQKLSQNTGTQDYVGACQNVKGYILACTRSTVGTPWTPGLTDPAILSIGLCDGTSQYNYNCMSLRRSLAADDTYTFHRGHDNRVLSQYLHPGTGLGDFHAAEHSAILPNGFRINKTVAQSGAANLPQMAGIVFYGDRQNFAVGKVLESGTEQTISLSFQPRAMMLIAMNFTEDFTATDYNDGMASIGLVAWNNAGSAIAAQTNGLSLESTGLTESDATYAELADNAFITLDQSGFGAIEYTANGFIVPVDVGPFIYAAWDWPSPSSDVVLRNIDVPAATGAYTMDYGAGVQAHNSEFAIGLLNGYDAGNGWAGGTTGSAEPGTWGLAFQTPTAQVCLGMAMTPGAAIPVSKSSFSAATGTDRAIQLQKGSDLAVGTQCSHTTHTDTGVTMDCTTAMTVGNRGMWLSCGRKCSVRTLGDTRDLGKTRYGGAT